MCSVCSLVVVYFMNTVDCQVNNVKKIMYKLGEREEVRGGCACGLGERGLRRGVIYQTN